MQTVYSWQCPKCGKKYVNGEEPTYCEEQLSLHAPAHPRADAATGLLATRCGAPILPLARPAEPFEEKASGGGTAPDGSLLAIAVSAVQGRGWPHLVLPEYESVEFTLNGRHSTLRVIVTAREEERQVIARAMLALKVPPVRRPAVAEYVTRANWAAIVGGFDFDFEEGLVRYRTGIDVDDCVLTEQMVNNVINASFCLADSGVRPTDEGDLRRNGPEGGAGADGRVRQT